MLVLSLSDLLVKRLRILNSNCQISSTCTAWLEQGIRSTLQLVVGRFWGFPWAGTKQRGCSHRKNPTWTMGLVRITPWYPNFNGSHFGLPPSEINRMTGQPPKIVWTMTYPHRPHCCWFPDWLELHNMLVCGLCTQSLLLLRKVRSNGAYKQALGFISGAASHDVQVQILENSAPRLESWHCPRKWGSMWAPHKDGVFAHWK